MGKRNDSIDYDGNWKRIIQSFFEEFVLFFAQDLYEKIDWHKQPEDLNKELQKIRPKNNAKDRAADNLYKVHLKDGQEKWILIHLEVQGYEDSDFAKRMFQYFYRIYDKYEKDVYAITIFTDDFNEAFKPDKFQYEFFGTRLEYRFNTYDIPKQDEEKLEKSNNPFSYVIIAAKKAALTKRSNDELKYEMKKQLLDILSNIRKRNGLSTSYVAALLVFMDNIIRMNDDYEMKFNDEINNWEGGMMLTFEQEIEERAKIKIAKSLIKFGDSFEKIKKVTNLPDETIKELQEKINE